MKIITVANKETGRKDRMGKLEAQTLVDNGTHHFSTKGAYKRQTKDEAKMAVRAKRKAIFGARYMRRYKEKQLQTEND